jgi:hypothetical protein
VLDHARLNRINPPTLMTDAWFWTVLVYKVKGNAQCAFPFMSIWLQDVLKLQSTWEQLSSCTAAGLHTPVTARHTLQT